MWDFYINVIIAFSFPQSIAFIILFKFFSSEQDRADLVAPEHFLCGLSELFCAFHCAQKLFLISIRHPKMSSERGRDRNRGNKGCSSANFTVLSRSFCAFIYLPEDQMGKKFCFFFNTVLKWWAIILSRIQQMKSSCRTLKALGSISFVLSILF